MSNVSVAVTTEKFPIRREGLKSSVLPDGFLVIIDESEQHAVTLNGTAAAVWEFCDGHHTVGDIFDALARLVPVDNREHFNAEVDRLIEQLSNDGLVRLS